MSIRWLVFLGQFVLLEILLRVLVIRVCAHKVGLHVIDPAVWVHKELVRFTFNLDLLHHHSINHVDWLSFFFIAFLLISIIELFCLVVDKLLLVVFILWKLTKFLTDVQAVIKLFVTTFVICLNIKCTLGIWVCGQVFEAWLMFKQGLMWICDILVLKWCALVLL
jgi:hypothetical protein